MDTLFEQVAFWVLAVITVGGALAVVHTQNMFRAALMLVVSFLEGFGVNLQHIAVGYNGIVLEKDKFSETILQDGDVLEVVRPVGGG